MIRLDLLINHQSTNEDDLDPTRFPAATMKTKKTRRFSSGAASTMDRLKNEDEEQGKKRQRNRRRHTIPPLYMEQEIKDNVLSEEEEEETATTWPSHRRSKSDDKDFRIENNAEENNTLGSSSSISSSSSRWRSTTLNDILSNIESLEELKQQMQRNSTASARYWKCQEHENSPNEKKNYDDDEENSSINDQNVTNDLKLNRQFFFGKLSNVFQDAKQSVEQKINDVKDKATQKFASTNHNGQSSPTSTRTTTRVNITAPRGRVKNGGILLYGCYDEYDHIMFTRETVDNLRNLKGRIGLKVAGFEYRVVSVDHVDPPPSDGIEGEPISDVPRDDGDDNEKGAVPEMEEEQRETVSPGSDHRKSELQPDDLTDKNDDLSSTMMTRLFHIETNQMITSQNRRLFIADGDMYDSIARLCQEYAQETMIKEGQMEWITLSETCNNDEPIRALVSQSLSEDDSVLDQKPTLLIATGRGKVRAGVFSRQHIMISGLECSTALPVIRQANKRQMNVIMLDPNAHGERLGMITFEKSMARLFSRWESKSNSSSSSTSSGCFQTSNRPPLARRDLFVLSHSQSGAQLANYLLEKSEHYVPHIRAVAFTDATHNIQWAKQKQDLRQLLESEKCVYFRCAKQQQQPQPNNNGDALEPLDSVGQPIETDENWQNRFGRIDTRCAGTAEHSLTNWFVLPHIWDHFDNFMTSVVPTRQVQQDNADKSEII